MRLNASLTCFLASSLFFSTAAAQTPAPIRLTLQDAIQRSLQANLGVLLAGTRVDEAEASRARALSTTMLPHVSAQTYANYQNRDLAAFGLSIPGIPQVAGPFSNYDFRLYAQQNVIDLAGYRQLKASQRAVDSGKLDLDDARDYVVRSVAAIYIAAESAAARSAAAQSRVNDSTALLKLANDKHDAGTATGVDVLRAQVQLANDRQALLVDDNQLKATLLSLARNIGMTPGMPLELADRLEYRPLSPAEAETLLAGALANRADYLSLAQQRQSLVDQQRANAARWYPKLSVNGNFGGIGRNIGSVAATGLLQGQIDFTVYDRDREGESQQIAARIRRIDDQIADTRRGVEEDLREALLNLDSASQQVAVAKSGQDLAERELELARDRFESGATNNIEVTTAQDSLARAQENYIMAVFSHADAKCALARAQGGTEKNILDYMGGR